MKNILKQLLKTIIFLLLYSQAQGNGITISNVVTIQSTSQVQVDITWNNSWRSDILGNWDAAWVFIKYHAVDGTWLHLSLTNNNNVIPAGYTINMPSDNTGAFLYRSAAGSGTATLKGVRLGIPSNIAMGVFDLKVFGIEMVYIPTAPFFVGDFKGSSNSYTEIGKNSPFYISASGDAAINLLHDPLWKGDPLSPTSVFGTSPVGYDSFYCMKYEISQGAYRDFLNCLTYNQQVSHTANAPGSSIGTNALTNNTAAYRSTIEIAKPGAASSGVGAVYGCDANNNNIFNESADGEWIACNYLTWPDLAAYLAWSCLEPMTELQYEKICRGPLQPVKGEFAWGTRFLTGNVYSFVNEGKSNETVSNPATNDGEGNAFYTVSNAEKNIPLRNGIFATSTSNRVSSGGSFYGVMEMSGNIFERVVTTANREGRTSVLTSPPFLPDLDGSGWPYKIADGGLAGFTPVWPGTSQLSTDEPTVDKFTVDGGTNAVGLMWRGGSFYHSAYDMRTSDRNAGYVLSTPDMARYFDQGGRGVRNL